MGTHNHGHRIRKRRRPSDRPSQGPVVAPAKIPDPDGPAAGSTLQVATLDNRSQKIVLDDIRLSSSFSAYAWMVPGFALGLPGLLVLIIVGLQMLVASVFVPLTRRSLVGSRGYRR